MVLNMVRFLSLLLAALALIPTAAILMGLPRRINLPGEDYLTVQQIYRGWELGWLWEQGWPWVVIALFLTVLSTLIWTIMVYRKHQVAALAFAFFCILGTLFMFWFYTHPVNQQTTNWTLLPENWSALRNQWEYSHAISAILILIALIALIISVLSEIPPNKLKTTGMSHLTP